MEVLHVIMRPCVRREEKLIHILSEIYLLMQLIIVWRF